MGNCLPVIDRKNSRGLGMGRERGNKITKKSFKNDLEENEVQIKISKYTVDICIIGNEPTWISSQKHHLERFFRDRNSNMGSNHRWFIKNSHCLNIVISLVIYMYGFFTNNSFYQYFSLVLLSVLGILFAHNLKYVFIPSNEIVLNNKGEVRTGGNFVKVFKIIVILIFIGLAILFIDSVIRN